MATLSRRTDRLFRILDLLRTEGQLSTVAIAEALGVSQLTALRDVRDLRCSGVPIVGDVDVGLRIDPSYHLAPLMFEEEELSALALGAQVVQCWGDPDLESAARRAIEKICAVLPGAFGSSLEALPLQRAHAEADDDQEQDREADEEEDREEEAAWLTTLRKAVDVGHKVRLEYVDAKGQRGDRTVWPLAILSVGKDQLGLAAWCESRKAFRTFRLDRIQRAVELDEAFPPKDGRTLNDYLKSRGLN
jgi:predicted DNA-binding transcriptional regulator YafY